MGTTREIIALEYEYKNGEVTTRQLKLSADQLARMEQHAGGVDRQFGLMGAAAGQLNKLLGGLSLALAGRTLLNWTNQAAEAGDKLMDMSKATRMTVEQLSRLDYAAKQSGADIDTVRNGMRLMAQNMDMATKGGKQQAAAFSTLGVAITDTQGRLRPTYDVLLDLADAFNAQSNSTQALALAADVFGGRFGDKLLPLLSEGRRGIMALTEESDKLGLTWSTEQASAADRYSDSLSRFNDSLLKVKMSLAEQLMPELERLANWSVKNQSNLSWLLGGAAKLAVHGIENNILLNAARGIKDMFSGGAPSGSMLPDEFKKRLDSVFGPTSGGMIPDFPGSAPGGGGDPLLSRGMKRGILGAGRAGKFRGSALAMPGETALLDQFAAPDEGLDFSVLYDQSDTLQQRLQLLGAYFEGQLPTAFERGVDRLNTLVYGVQGTFDRMFSAIIDGSENAGAATLKATAGIIGQLASQQGQFYFLKGLAMLFDPFAVGNGAGLMAAGTALMAFGAGMGAASRSGGGGRGGSGGGYGSGAGYGQTYNSGYSSAPAMKILVVTANGTPLASGSNLDTVLARAQIDRQIRNTIREQMRTGKLID